MVARSVSTARSASLLNSRSDCPARSARQSQRRRHKCQHPGRGRQPDVADLFLAVVSPLRTDSRQLVSKIYWWQNAKNGIMREPEWREPTGFVWFAPAGGGNLWVDVNRRIIQNYPHGRGFCVTEFACLVPALPA